jgi:hypothetical protein
MTKKPSRRKKSPAPPAIDHYDLQLRMGIITELNPDDDGIDDHAFERALAVEFPGSPCDVHGNPLSCAELNYIRAHPEEFRPSPPPASAQPVPPVTPTPPPPQATGAPNVPPPATEAKPALAGKRFVISHDFHTVTDLNERKPYPDLELLTTLALEHMVTHAPSKSSWQSGPSIVAGVKELYKQRKGKEPKANYNVVHLFRKSQTGTQDNKVTWPFYKSLVKNNGRGGMYWLNIDK